MTPIALLLALSGSAQAESEILFRTTRPVVILVDGRQAPLTGDLRMKAGALEPGLHDIEVRGVFGKTLYTTAMELPDWTVAHTEWTGQKLRVTRTEVLEAVPRRLGPSPWQDEDAPEESVVDVEQPEETGPIVVAAPAPADPPAAPVAPEPAADDVAVAEPEPPAAPPAPAPAAEPQVALPSDAPLAVPAQEPAEAGVLPVVGAGEVAWIGGSADPAPAPQGTSGQAPTMRVQAREGVRLELVSAEGTMFVTLQDGAFVVEVADQPAQ